VIERCTLIGKRRRKGYGTNMNSCIKERAIRLAARDINPKASEAVDPKTLKVVKRRQPKAVSQRG
jgi:hypothetical protein